MALSNWPSTASGNTSSAPRDAVDDGVLVLLGRTTQHPRGDPVLVTRMTDADAQTMELGVAQVRNDVAQAVLAAVATVELHAYGAGIEIQLVVCHQALFRLDLVVAQRRNHSDAALVHEGGGLEQPHRLAADANFAGLAVQLAVETEALALP